MAKSESAGASEPKAKGLRKKSARQNANLSPTMRIDPPHEEGSASVESSPQQLPTAEKVADEPAAQQIRFQADQLAAHLRDRQKELDRREAELNSRIARWESETRAARLWMSQRETEAKESGTPAELQQLREQLLSRQQAFDEEITATRERMAAEHQQAMADIEQKRHDIQSRADSLDRSRAALKQIRAELAKMQRETLEIRLSTEELWIELSGAAPPAALTQSLGRIRSKLAEEYRQANAELAEQRKELEEIRTQMTLQFEKLNERKQQFDRWVADRREELQQQASRLVAREQQIRHEERQSLSSVGYASA
jgi:fused signal recognition particle receptor